VSKASLANDIRQLVAIAVVVAFAAIAPARALECVTLPDGCQKVSIDSAGTFGFRRDKIRGIAVWREIGGIAPWIDIVAPADQAVSKIILSADLSPTQSPHCFERPWEPESVTCDHSIPGVKLQAIITFPKSGADTARYEEITRSLIKYILDEVLCCQLRDYSKPERATKLMGPGTGLSSRTPACDLLPKSRDRKSVV